MELLRPINDIYYISTSYKMFRYQWYTHTQGRRKARVVIFFGIFRAASFINKNIYFSPLFIIFTRCKSKTKLIFIIQF